MSSTPVMDILSRYLPAYRPAFTTLTSIHPKKIMQSLNGKLVTAEMSKEISDFNKLQQQIENLAQQFDHLELQMTLISEQDKTDYLKQIVSVQLSLQKLERIYSCILSTTILSAIGIASWSIFSGFNHDRFPVNQVNSTVESALTKPSENR